MIPALKQQMIKQWRHDDVLIKLLMLIHPTEHNICVLRCLQKK